MIGRALYVLSLFLILFWLFTSHRPAVYAPTFVTLFFTSIFLAVTGSLTIRISEKMVEKNQRRG
jgi:phosphoglycerol transferase MdoB-like AlkP superfamily enzyme